MTLEAPEGWRVASLRELGELIKARGGTKKDAAEQGIPVVRYGELYTKHDAVIRRFYSFVAPQASSSYTPLKSGDVLFAGSGETLEDIGRSAAFVGPEPALAGGDLIILRPTTAIDSVFLGYATNAAPFVSQKRRVGQGSSVFHIHADEVAQLVLKVPPHTEQQKIAAILSSVDEAIEATQAVIDQLQLVKKATVADLLTRGVSGRHTEFKHSELGDVPAGWEVRSIEDLGREGEATVRTGPFGSSMKTEDFRSSGIPVLTIQSLGEGEIVRDGLFYVDQGKADELAAYCVQPNDLVFSRVADIGRCAAIGPNESGWLISPNLTRIRLDPVKADAAFVMYLLKEGHLVRRQVEAVVGNAGRAVISSTTLKALRLPIANLDEQLEIAAAGRKIERRLAVEGESLTGLNELKAALASVLLTGEVRVSPSPAEASP